MPELPEVETVRVGLGVLLPKRQIKSVDFNWPKSFPNAPSDVKNFLLGSRVKDVRRRAKVLIIDLDSDYSLVIHLKMTGQLVFVAKQQKPSPVTSHQSSVTGDRRLATRNPKADLRFGAGHPNDSLIGELPDKSTRVTFSFKDNSQLFFNDQRKFGWVRLLPTVEVENLDFFKKVGPEPLADSFTATDFVARLMRRKNSGIKAVLLDQTVIAGVGNIYADESLWAAKIHPEAKVADLSRSHPEKFKLLYSELRRILRLAIEKGGSTDRNYVNHEGRRGSYLSFANVFRRQGQPCPRCGTNIVKLRVAGRGTHICPTCQKL